MVGQGQLWRIDPTGLFYRGFAAAVGRDSERAEALLYQTLVERQQKSSTDSLEAFLLSLSESEAKEILLECLESVVKPKRIAAVTKALATKALVSNSQTLHGIPLPLL